jgi:hypothetical protein
MNSAAFAAVLRTMYCIHIAGCSPTIKLKVWWHHVTIFVYLICLVHTIYHVHHSCLFLHRQQAKLEKPLWDVHLRSELAPALQQTEALPTELRCTLTELRRTLTELCRSLTELCTTLIELRRTQTDIRHTLTELRRISLHGGGNGGGGGLAD